MALNPSNSSNLEQLALKGLNISMNDVHILHCGSMRKSATFE